MFGFSISNHIIKDVPVLRVTLEMDYGELLHFERYRIRGFWYIVEEQPSLLHSSSTDHRVYGQIANPHGRGGRSKCQVLDMGEDGLVLAASLFALAGQMVIYRNLLSKALLLIAAKSIPEAILLDELRDSPRQFERVSSLLIERMLAIQNWLRSFGEYELTDFRDDNRSSITLPFAPAETFSI